MSKQIMLKERPDHTFEIICDEPLISLNVAQGVLDEALHVATQRVKEQCVNDFKSTEDGKLLFETYKEVKFLRFMLKLSYITCFAIIIYFVWRLYF